MRNVMRIALEGMEREPEAIVMKGPLGQAMTNALNVAYAKTDPVTGEATTDGAAMESQAQDVTVMSKLINAVNNSDDADVKNGVEIYAVSENDIEADTVVDVVSDMDESKAGEFVVIADVSAPQNEDGTGEVAEDIVDLDAEEVVAIESMLETEESLALEAAGKDKKDIKVKKGDKVTIVVSADAEDDIHLHGYDIEKPVEPGKPAEFKFTADIEGIFEIESHVAEDAGREPLMGKLTVEP